MATVAVASLFHSVGARSSVRRVQRSTGRRVPRICGLRPMRPTWWSYTYGRPSRS